ncbi:MAG: hypothetical protein HOW73_08500 [Polyangiaceae bacterium]|nr:hypothetical protein [Polyangiaceae bacterium]
MNVASLVKDFLGKPCAIVGAVASLAAGLGGCSANVVVTGECTVDGKSYEEGETFTDGCNTCTCLAGGSVDCTENDCSDGCVYDGVFRDVGETFVASDGCNTCTCVSPENVECTNQSCACQGPVPKCEPPDPNCSSTPVCEGDTWQCVVECNTECVGVPPDCPSPGPGCFYEGPYCVNGQWTCGNVVCEKGCDDDPPPCAQPKNPNCWAEAICMDFGWECDTFCNDVPCEEQYPEGYETVIFLIFNECGCEQMSPCLMECGSTQVCGGDGNTGACEQCVQNQAQNGAQCVSDAAFGNQCQNDPECAGYIDCVINQG